MPKIRVWVGGIKYQWRLEIYCTSTLVWYIYKKRQKNMPVRNLNMYDICTGIWSTCTCVHAYGRPTGHIRHKLQYVRRTTSARVPRYTYTYIYSSGYRRVLRYVEMRHFISEGIIPSRSSYTSPKNWFWRGIKVLYTILFIYYCTPDEQSHGLILLITSTPP